MHLLHTSVLIAGVALSSGFAVAQSTTEVVAPNIDFDQLLASCAEDGATCAATLQATLAEITTAKQAGLAASTVDKLLGSLATIAVSTAQQQPSTSTSLASAISKIAQQASPARQQALSSVSTNIETTDLGAVAGSQSGG